VDVFDLFDDTPPVYRVQTWQYAKYDRVIGYKGSWGTVEEAIGAASNISGVGVSKFEEADPDDDLETLPVHAYDKKLDLVVIYRQSSGSVVSLAPLPSGFQPEWLRV